MNSSTELWRRKPRRSGGLSPRWLLLALVYMLRTGDASAHSFEPALLDLQEREPGVFAVAWKLPGPESGSLPAGANIVPQLPAHCRRLDQFADADGEGPAYWRIDCGAAGLDGAALGVGGLDGTRLDVLVRVAWRNGDSLSAVLRSDEPRFVLPGGRGAQNDAPTVVLRSYGLLGVEHIWLGYDHLLFVFGLLLLVESLGTLIKTISAFTVAHSVALALAVFGVIAVPPAPVEALIAGSIVLVARELTQRADAPPTLTRRFPWVVAFVFGLVHGLGFAGALSDIGLPKEQIGLALLAFNLGVEAGQLVFVAAMLVPLRVLAGCAARWPRTRLIPAYTIGALATAWTIERVHAFWVIVR